MILGQSKRIQNISVLAVFSLALVLIAVGSVACGQKSSETAAALETEKATALKEGLNDFEGTVVVASEKYFFLKEVQGIDILVPDMPNLASLEGKSIKLQGEFNRQRPSLLVANKIQTAEGEVYARSAEPDFSDYVDLRDRASYPAMKFVNILQVDSWEGKSKGKIFGKLQKQTVTEGGATKDVYRLNANDDKGKLVGAVLIDGFTDYASYYLKKLRLFDSFWFYLNIKSTVEAKARVKTKDLFHADAACIGLF